MLSLNVPYLGTIQADFHIKGFAWELVFKLMQKVTRERPIGLLACDCFSSSFTGKWKKKHL